MYFATGFMISIKRPLRTSASLDLTFQERTHTRENETQGAMCEQWHTTEGGALVCPASLPGAGDAPQAPRAGESRGEPGAVPPSVREKELNARAHVPGEDPQFGN